MAGINDEVLHSGISKNTPGNIMFGAGTFHKGLKYGEHYAPTTDTYKHPDKTYYTISGGSSEEYRTLKPLTNHFYRIKRTLKNTQAGI